MSYALQPRLKVCCEPDCNLPVCARSRVRCDRHYFPPRYGVAVKLTPQPQRATP